MDKMDGTDKIDGTGKTDEMNQTGQANQAGQFNQTEQADQAKDAVTSDNLDVMDFDGDDGKSLEDDAATNDGTTDDIGEKPKKKWSLPNLLLMLVGIAMIGFAVYRIGSLMINYSKSNKEYDEITGDYVTINSGDLYGTEGEASTDGSSDFDWSTKETTIWYEMISVDVASLSSRYPDVVAWLYQEGDTAISYPVMYSGDNSTYIHTTYKGSYAYAGSIFIEGLNNPDFNDAHTIIYGHNMRNGSMFGTLRYLQTKDNYIEDHGFFQIHLADEIRRYQVFAYEIVEESSWLYEIPSLESDDYTTLLDKIRNASEINVDVEVTNEDKIITLSTCYGTNTTRRFVVQAVWVDTYYKETGMTQSDVDELEAVEGVTESSTEDEPQETEEELEFLAQ